MPAALGKRAGGRLANEAPAVSRQDPYGRACPTPGLSDLGDESAEDDLRAGPHRARLHSDADGSNGRTSSFAAVGERSDRVRPNGAGLSRRLAHTSTTKMFAAPHLIPGHYLRYGRPLTRGAFRRA